MHTTAATEDSGTNLGFRVEALRSARSVISRRARSTGYRLSAGRARYSALAAWLRVTGSRRVRYSAQGRRAPFKLLTVHCQFTKLGPRRYSLSAGPVTSWQRTERGYSLSRARSYSAQPPGYHRVCAAAAQRAHYGPVPKFLPSLRAPMMGPEAALSHGYRDWPRSLRTPSAGPVTVTQLRPARYFSAALSRGALAGPVTQLRAGPGYSARRPGPLLTQRRRKLQAWGPLLSRYVTFGF
eukprot:764217-Hanusia_phi.AAC.5